MHRNLPPGSPAQPTNQSIRQTHQQCHPLHPPNNPSPSSPPHAGDIIRIGHDLTLRVTEDGSNTDNRLGVAELILAPHATGPPAHWHKMHDETFLATQGTVRFFGAEVKDFQGKMLAEAHGKEAGEKEEVAVDAGAGDYVTVGTRAPHIFANPSGEEKRRGLSARFINTFTPAFYVDYFKLMADLLQGGPLTPEINTQAMSSYATIPVEKRK